MNEFVSSSDFYELIREKYNLIDVRSEGEFEQGHVPGSINIPILNNEERAQVGATYKKQGQDAAVQLGKKLVSGNVKDQRVAAWIEASAKNKKTVLTCFRGGLRSRFAQEWCREAGLAMPRVEGGTKKFRQFLSDELDRRSENCEMVLITGPTGSGKSILIKEIITHRACMDLEKMAHHRGSAFGSYPQKQPSQVVFENLMSCEMIKLETALAKAGNLVIEDESRLIGTCALPWSFFERMRISPGVFVDESLESRTQTTFNEYILETDLIGEAPAKAIAVFEHYQRCLQRISKKLGGVNSSEILKDLAESREAYFKNRDLEINKGWIRKLLALYYDPLYLGSLEKRNLKYLFRGSRKEVTEFLKS
ncbi:MAG: tRNA 2-selenouridine(34) synthase MnmH [Pseudobdellovibrionaceae bacterium]